MSRAWLLVLSTGSYLALLAIIAELVERHRSWAKVARRPVVLGLALGVYATTWSFYGSVGFATAHGYGFLAIQLGCALSCLAIPLLWQPLGVLVRRHRLASVADLLAFRYQSQTVGVVVTTFLAIALLPYLSLQLRAIVETGEALVPSAATGEVGLGLIYAVLLCTFAVLIGTRWADTHGRGAGLLATLAVESTVKVGVLLVAGWVAFRDQFHDFSGLDHWLQAHPESLSKMFLPVQDDSWIALTFAAFVAAFLLPRQFHVAFVLPAHEDSPRAALRHTTWVLPLLLLCLNLPLPVLIWVGQATPGWTVAPDLWVLDVSARHGLGLLVFLGGVSAASAMVLVAAISLSGMVVNHVVLPIVGERWLLQRFVWVRRVVIVTVVLAGFALHLVLPEARLLVDLGLVSFAAVAQLFPGVLAALFWPRATERGVLVGLALGVSVWLIITVLPLLGADVGFFTMQLVGVAKPSPAEGFGPALWLSLSTNAGALGMVSLWHPQRAVEADAAAACRREHDPTLVGPAVDLDVLRERLAAVLGERKASREIGRALRQLGLDAHERRPGALRDVARVLEASLAERLGPLAAGVLVGRTTDEPRTLAALAAELNLRERGGASWPSRPGIHPLELIRSYLAQVVAELPLGVCAVEADGSVVVWNGALARLSGVDAERVVGLRLDRIPDPWGPLLAEIHASEYEAQRERTLPSESGPRILRFRRAGLVEGEAGAVLMVEDLTERRAMLAELGHRDRLSSIGRLAAGVAHEVLNPLTGILMVARNIVRELDRLPEDVDGELPQRLSTIVTEAQRIERIVRTLLLFSRAGTQQEGVSIRESIALDGLVEEALGLARLARTGRAAVEFELRVEPGASVHADRQALVQVLINLLTNAIDASPPAGRVRVEAGTTGDRVMIDVVDEGPGIPDELAPRVFEPFFTTKEPGAGTGLGLATSYRIIGEQGGSLTWSPCRPEPPRGARFRVTLPSKEPPP